MSVHRLVVVAIDIPRSCAPEGHGARDGELQLAKSTCRIRRTPDVRHVQQSPYYAWIIEGHALLALSPGAEPGVVEVFPTAMWTRWQGERGPEPCSLTWQGLVCKPPDQHQTIPATKRKKHPWPVEPRSPGSLVGPPSIAEISKQGS